MKIQRVAVIGAGMAGAACARALADVGLDVSVFDKSRGVGGRMATRRAALANGAGGDQGLTFDHGVPWWVSGTDAFTEFLTTAQAQGAVQPWGPRIAGQQAHGAAPSKPRSWVAQPDMPGLVRWMLKNIPVHTGCTVQTLQEHEHRWALTGDGMATAAGFDAVVVAIPPRQAAVLWAPHSVDWATRAQAQPMSPCWTLMGVPRTVGPERAEDPAWDVLAPTTGPLSLVVRQDRKPGGASQAAQVGQAGPARWVAHATAAWSEQQLESDPDMVRQALQAAMESALGHPLTWQHAVVHRWRYAQPAGTEPAPLPCWWDGSAGLGACGDYLGGGGVEGAWHSGVSLARAILS